MRESVPALRAAAARAAPGRLGGALAGLVAAVVLAVALRDPAGNGPGAGAVLLVALMGLLARRPLARVAADLPGGLRARLYRSLALADGAETAMAALAALAMLVRPAHVPLVAAGLAGLLLMGAVARLTLCVVLRRALDAKDDPDAR